MLGRGLRSHRRRHGRRAAEEIQECVERSYRFPGGADHATPTRLPDEPNRRSKQPVLVLKAWRDHEHTAERISACHTARTRSRGTSFARSIQPGNPCGRRRKRTPTAKPSSHHLGLSGPPEEMLDWGCDPDGTSEAQQALSICLRTLDGQLKGNMTEPDLVPITADDVCSVECKLSLTSLPGQRRGQSHRRTIWTPGNTRLRRRRLPRGRRSGCRRSDGGPTSPTAPSLRTCRIPSPKTGTFTSSSGTPSTPACSVTPSARRMRSCYRS